MRKWDETHNLTLLMDFYELTMANEYLENGLQDKIAYFDMFFSNYLYYAIGRADQHLAESVSKVDQRIQTQLRLNQMNPNYLLNTLEVV